LLELKATRLSLVQQIRAPNLLTGA